jgi:hypothetical protein
MTKPLADMETVQRLGLVLAEIAHSARIVKESLSELYQYLGPGDVGTVLASCAEAHGERIGLLADFAQAAHCGGEPEMGGVSAWLLPPMAGRGDRSGGAA